MKFLLLGVGIVASMGFLLIVGMNRPGGLAYYLSVSEFVQAPDRVTGDFRINGKVADGTIERQPTGQDVAFAMTDGANRLPVSYHGIIPDTFVDGADVVVEGRLRDDGVFEAHTLLAKCPSKYEAADGAGDSYGKHPEEIPR
jgi:cytochrome c-type biogenesis protein CcmE